MAKLHDETIIKFNDMCANAMHEIDSMSPDEKARLHVTISKGNSKIGKVMNISILPVMTCGGCGKNRGGLPCVWFCYDVRDCLRFPENVLKSRAKNTWLLIHEPARFWAEIDAAMTRRRKHKFIRFHVGGEIMSTAHFGDMVDLMKKHPDFIGWTYTKKYRYVNRYIAEHGGTRAAAYSTYFTVMFSEWDGVPVDNPYDLPLFTTRLKAGNKNHPETYFKNLFKCPGKCIICLSTGHGCPFGETTTNDEH